VSPAIAFRCDGGRDVGAGHVARCLPLAGAFAERGWTPTFVGSYDGLAAWLLERSGLAVAPPAGGPAGVGGRWAAAVVDSYSIPVAEICALAAALPVATLGEANRCPERAFVLDYHLDAAPGLALVDPRFAAARRRREPVRTALVTVGGSAAAAELVPRLVAGVRRAFPGVDVVEPPRDAYGTLLDLVERVDVACSGAGLTAYELACAGVPSVVVAVADNQRRVLQVCEQTGIAIGLDAVDGLDERRLDAALVELARPERRRELAVAGPREVDGEGAARAASLLLERWSRR
jgi:spore coat polysaccharide biosynthesis predicted glycosyltransferase SpsG